MFRWFESRIVWGALLILGGVMFLLQNLGLFRFGDLFWIVLLGLGGATFLSVFVSNRQHWWALIPGFALLSIAFVALLGFVSVPLSEAWGGAIVLGGIGASFLVIYLLNTQFWWALIPAGVMGTLALITLVENFTTGINAGGILFLGIGATFALLTLLPSSRGSMQWAWIPAGIMFVMGLVTLGASGDLLGLVWPLVLILGGGVLLLRAFRPRLG